METVMGEEWRAREADLNAIAAARNSDPFAVLGPHQTPQGWVIRVFAPEAVSVRALTRATTDLKAQMEQFGMWDDWASGARGRKRP